MGILKIWESVHICRMFIWTISVIHSISLSMQEIWAFLTLLLTVSLTVTICLSVRTLTTQCQMTNFLNYDLYWSMRKVLLQCTPTFIVTMKLKSGLVNCNFEFLAFCRIHNSCKYTRFFGSLIAFVELELFPKTVWKKPSQYSINVLYNW